MVSIIIPIYNVEQFIGKNVQSLLSQTYDDCEFIFVDDCTPDNSVSIIESLLEKYPKRKHQVSILRHKENKGLPAARNTGLSVAKGDYIYHCDSDDWLEHDAIESMVLHAENYSADIVYTDYYLSFQSNERYMKQPEFSEPLHAVESMLCGRMKYNVWNKLVLRELYTDYNINFPEGRTMGEDMTLIKLFAVAKTIAYLPNAIYHYIQINSHAITKKFSAQHEVALYENTLDTISFLKSRYKEELRTEIIHYFKLNVKLPFLISTQKNMYILWRKWFPESNAYISKNPSYTLRIKVLQYAAMRKLDWYIILYNRIVVKLIYGIIYR